MARRLGRVDMIGAAKIGAAKAPRGVALVAVLWIVAALSILVTGMVQAQRNEVRLVSAARQTLQASATGAAAIQLALQELASRNAPVARLSRVQMVYGGATVAVDITPLNGFIDINRAPERLLTALFAVAGGLQAEPAAALARSIVAARAPGVGRARGPRFEAIEDLLQLPGIDFDLYARLSSVVTTDSLSSGRVNPMAAPEAVLVVLAEGNAARAGSIAAARDAGQAGIDITHLTAEFLDTAATTRFRFQARVPLADGRQLLSARMADLARAAPDGMPWRIFHAEDRFEPPSVPRSATTN